MIWAALLTELAHIVFCFTPYFFLLILGHNVALRLIYRSRLYIWVGVWVHPAYIILTWIVGGMYHIKSLHLPIYCLDLMKRYDSPGPNGVICSCPDAEFPWQYTPSLLPKYDHWVSFPNFFLIYRLNTGFWYTSNLVNFLYDWMLSTCKESLVDCANVRWG